MEEWKDVVSYEGSYQVSSFGRIKSLSRLMRYESRGRVGYRLAKEIIKAPSKTRNGYYNVSLYKNDKEKKCSVSRLVAIAFLPNPDNKKTVNHLDSIRTNNVISNLEWATQSENIIHGIKSGSIIPYFVNHKSQPFSGFYGKKHTEETKIKIRESMIKARENKFWSSRRRVRDA